MVKSDQELLKIIKRDIEKKLFSEHRILKGRDLKYIAECLEEQSDITLSLSTLKRIWKEDYAQTPQPSTLNALAALLGYSNWQAYKDATLKTVQKDTRIKTFNIRRVAYPVLAVLFLGTIWNLAFTRLNFQKKTPPSINGSISFSADKTVSEGVPNTVIFSYDVSLSLIHI